MANHHKAILVVLGVSLYLMGCAEPCDCLKWEPRLATRFYCAEYDYDAGYCKRTAAEYYQRQQCVKCAEETTAAQ